MKKIFLVTLTIALVCALATCDNGDSGGDKPQTVTYTGISDGITYTLVITENTARYAAQIGDAYELTVGAQKSTGTVSIVTSSVLTLKPSNSSATFTVTIVAAENKIIKLTGTITWADTTTEPAPGALNGSSDPHTHDAGTWITTQQPTCTEAGTKELRCTVDNFVLDTGTIPALGHDWGAWEETTAPTTTTEGEATRTCNTCEATEKKAVDKLPPCTCDPGTKQEPGEPCCEDPNCPCPIAEPDIKTFSVSFDFQNEMKPGVFYDVEIKDARTAAGSPTLQDIKVGGKSIITIIEEEIMGAFTTVPAGPAGGAVKSNFRNVFGDRGNSVTIYVDNTAATFKIKAPDNKTIRFHINYLKGDHPNIQQEIQDAVSAMNIGGNRLPYNADAPAPATITQNTTPSLAFDGKVTIKTSDPYTASAWNAVVTKVVAALNAAYEEGPPPAQTQFITVFSNTLDSDGRGNGEIVLVNNLTNNWEVKDGEFMTVYLKTGSIATADYKTLIQRMLAKVPDIGKATLPKDRLFLA